VLTAKDLQLMAQESDLDVFRGCWASASNEELEECEEGVVHGRSGHPVIVTRA
jgi:hypothetical protein